MKPFREYTHIERLGTTETQNIELGECYIFPKVDGTNASVWLSDGVLCAGSRTRQLTDDKDNAGFYAWVKGPRLLNTVFYCIVKEESWNFTKQHKNPVIDFKRLQHFVFCEVKERKPELF